MSQSVSLNHAQPDTADLVAAARHLGAMIRDRRDESERERRLPATVLSAMHDARLFRMYVPIEYGGLETDPITSMQVVEAVAEADAAVAWNLMIGATYGIWAAYLPEASAREIYGAPDAIVAGALRASGVARAATGGYQVSGRWAFASGIDHCAWWNGGCIVHESGSPRPTDTSVGPPLTSRAQMMRAILLARATVTSIFGLRANICASHEPLGAPRRLAC